MAFRLSVSMFGVVSPMSSTGRWESPARRWNGEVVGVDYSAEDACQLGVGGRRGKKKENERLWLVGG